MAKLSRRQFLSRTVAGSFGIAAAAGPLLHLYGEETPFAWTARKPVNPSIDNLRVVCGHNPVMIGGDPKSWEIADQCAVVVASEVERTLDAMAVSLTQKSALVEAWQTIFRKPASKSWNAVKAAIKVNCNAKNCPRVAVINKICKELNALGVQFGNIIIYDGRSTAKPFYAPFVGRGLPAGVVVSDKNDALGGAVKAPVPVSKPKNYTCTRAIADGSVDILINIAVNKGADEKFGSTTLTLKNHAGTFEPMPLHIGGGMDYLLAFNKSGAIVGGDPVRQQLCIVDTLWGALKGPFGVPDKRLDRLVMGTFSPAVDYLTAVKIREPLLNAKHKNISRFLADFGYRENEIGDLIMASL
jgi:hypothetical protein